MASLEVVRMRPGEGLERVGAEQNDLDASAAVLALGRDIGLLRLGSARELLGHHKLTRLGVVSDQEATELRHPTVPV